MSFGVKNGSPTYQKTITKTFKEYLDNFMKIFLDDFIVYNDMESHLQKLKLCFQKYKDYGISLNLDKCAFMVFSRMILGFIISKKGKLSNPNKIQAIVNMPTTQESKIDSSIQWDGTILQIFYQNLCYYYGTYH
jgi:hypothetical protein